MRSKLQTLLCVAILTALLQSSLSVYGQVRTSKYPKLRPTHKLWDEPVKIAPVRVSSSRTLVTVGDTIYMLNAKRKIIWKWDVGSGQNIVDQPIIDSHGFIYGIALDGEIFSLDENGQLRWSWHLNGASNFSQIKPYVNGQYLVVRDNSFYREVQGFNEDDGLYLCKDRDVIATIHFPRDAILRVQGKHIYAVIKSKHGTRMKEVRFGR
jgi:hypothetical protein